MLDSSSEDPWPQTPENMKRLSRGAGQNQAILAARFILFTHNQVRLSDEKRCWCSVRSKLAALLYARDGDGREWSVH